MSIPPVSQGLSRPVRKEEDENDLFFFQWEKKSFQKFKIQNNKLVWNNLTEQNVRYRNKKQGNKVFTKVVYRHQRFR